MKKMLTAGLMVLATLFAGAVMAASTKDISPYPLGERSVLGDRATAERIKPVGSVCVEGEECGSTVAAAEGSGEPRSGQAVYDTGCAACHATGAAGAPKFGDAGQWASHIEKGMDTLVKHAFEGFNAMPPKGMCMDCSEEEIRNAVEYIVENSQ